MPFRVSWPASLRLDRGRRFTSQLNPDPQILPPERLVNEEKLPNYKSKYFYPANPSDVLEDKYKLIAKVGWGSTSTVWLAHDVRSGGLLRPKRYVAIKLCNCDSSEADMNHEVSVTDRLNKANPDLDGFSVLGAAIGAMTVILPRGNTHLALVFQPLCEPIWLYVRHLIGQDHPSLELLPLMKTYIKIILQGLDYMHSQARVIHTDLKLDNILVTFEAESTIVYLCHNEFGPVLGNYGNVIPQITDFGLAQFSDKKEPLIHPIQLDEYRAPEVMLGIGWSYGADMWNFGTMIWDLLAGRTPFHQSATTPYLAA